MATQSKIRIPKGYNGYVIAKGYKGGRKEAWTRVFPSVKQMWGWTSHNDATVTAAKPISEAQYRERVRYGY